MGEKWDRNPYFCKGEEEGGRAAELRLLPYT